jgi:hypothetical protein
MVRCKAGVLALGIVGMLGAGSKEAHADAAADVVARARAQVESGQYALAEKTLASLPEMGVPSALRVEAGLLSTTAALVTRGQQEGQAACASAVLAADYDPDVAKDESPKVRSACVAAAGEERSKRVAREGVSVGSIETPPPAVAWQPVRISAAAGQLPPWLKVVVRVTSSAFAGSYDLPLAPSLEGVLQGTIDASWIRPGAEISMRLVGQDRFGDLGPIAESVLLRVPTSEAMLSLGKVPGDATVSIDGDTVSVDEKGRIPVKPGSHRVSMLLTSGASATATVEVQRGAVARVALSPQRGIRTAPWIATGSSLLLATVGVVLFINADSRRAEIEELSAQREEGTSLPVVDWSEIQAKDDERRAFARAGTGLLIAAGAAGVTAAVLWLWPEKKSSRESASKRTTQVMPSLTPTAAGIAVGTTF